MGLPNPLIIDDPIGWPIYEIPITVVQQTENLANFYLDVATVLDPNHLTGEPLTATDSSNNPLPVGTVSLDPISGEVEVIIRCNLSDTGTTTVNLIYGGPN